VGALFVPKALINASVIPIYISRTIPNGAEDVSCLHHNNVPTPLPASLTHSPLIGNVGYRGYFIRRFALPKTKILDTIVFFVVIEVDDVFRRSEPPDETLEHKLVNIELLDDAIFRQSDSKTAVGCYPGRQYSIPLHVPNASPTTDRVIGVVLQFYPSFFHETLSPNIIRKVGTDPCCPSPPGFT
jgi:hypothetical protein